MVCTAFAGEDPYIAVVGNDILANPFYLSPKYQQFTFDQTLFGVPICDPFNTSDIKVTTQTRVGGAGCEMFRSQTPTNQPEICDTQGTVNGVGDFTFFGEPNAVTRANNSGFYEWYVRLPKKPDGEINLCIQCGVLKANAFAFNGFESVELCAAETGERVGPNCTRLEVPFLPVNGAEDWNPVINTALPKITALAIRGPFSDDAVWGTQRNFHLTAFRNPGPYTLDIGAVNDGTFIQLANGLSTQVLDASTNARILLKSCMDKCVVVKLPVEGTFNAVFGEAEHDLEYGDIIYVKMAIPRTSGIVSGGTDIYCHSQSLRVMGIGETPF